MHIHFHNRGMFGATEAIVHDQALAAGLRGHWITFGRGEADFHAQAATLQVMVGMPFEMKRLDLAAAPKLRLLQSYSAGVDALAPFDAIPPGVILANNRGTHAAKAGEYAAMAMLMLVNRLPAFATAQREGAWRRVNSGLAATQRVTIVGLGSLGGSAAEWAQRLGMRVTGIRYGTDPHPHCERTFPMAALDAVLPETDILVLACPLTQATRGILSAARIAALPRNAGVINIGRGPLVDQLALFAALNEDRLGGAILDVFDPEPIPAGDPAWTTKNLIVTPHVSSDDLSTYNARTLEILAENIRRLEAGEALLTPVDLSKGY